jgi:beta-glucosidase
MVLLKNDGALLPLDRGKTKSIAVIGPDANPAVPVGGGSAQVQPFSSVSFLKGVSDSLGTDASVYYHRGLPTLSQMTNATQFFTAPTGGKPGLTTELFNNPDLSGTPASTRIDRHVNKKPRFSIPDLADVDFSEIIESLGKPDAAAPNGTSSRWTGYYNSQQAGTFEVFLQASGENGGHRLYVDDKLVFDGWAVRKALIEHTTLNLTTGPHKVVLEKFQPGEPDFFGGTLRLGIFAETNVVDPAAKALAAKADVVVVAVGFEPDSESEGGDRTFSLPPGQEELIREIAAINKNVVVVATSGGAVDASGWLNRVPAFIEAWYAGQEGGTALADVLWGNVNPSGRLPISYDRRWEENPSHDSYYPEPGTKRVIYKNGIFVGYRGYDHAGTKPLFPFGYGLSYTTFKYGNLTIKNTGDAKHIQYQVSLDVTNTGKQAGAEIAQVYVGDPASKVSRPPKELKGFSKVYLQPGETKVVSVILDGRAFAYYDMAGKQWQIAGGNYDVLVGRNSQQIELTGKVNVSSAAVAR